jgi:glycosyltransferase involved in cell wall biosynthesis
VIFDQQLMVGGGYQQALNALLLTRKLSPQLADIRYFATEADGVATLACYDIEARLLALSQLEQAQCQLRRRIGSRRLLRLIQRLQRQNPFEQRLAAEGIDLVYFLSPSVRARDLERLNYMVTLWDLSHRDDPEFPEVRWDRTFESREAHYRAILPRATAVLVDAELGKQHLIHRYGIDAERVHIMPYEPSQACQRSETEASTDELPALSEAPDMRAKYQLTVPYVFYPAQFWAHKNHVYLLDGLKMLEERHGIILGAIFAGSDKGNRAYVEQYGRRRSLTERIRFAGFVPNQEMPHLYRQSVALVMPTYFGPTNLPPLEAFALGVPVLYPDRPGLREQGGDAVLLMDLQRPITLADHLAALLRSPSLRDRLAEAGKRRLQAQPDRVQRLEAILEAFRWRRHCWGPC